MNSGHLSDDAGKFELLVQSVTDYAIYMLDPRGIVTSWNPGARRFKVSETQVMPLPGDLTPYGYVAIYDIDGDVATALECAPATASHHLTTLRDAGLIAATRDGRRLLYQRTSLGDRLTEA